MLDQLGIKSGLNTVQALEGMTKLRSVKAELAAHKMIKARKQRKRKLLGILDEDAKAEERRVQCRVF